MDPKKIFNLSYEDIVDFDLKEYYEKNSNVIFGVNTLLKPSQLNMPVVDAIILKYSPDVIFCIQITLQSFLNKLPDPNNNTYGAFNSSQQMDNIVLGKRFGKKIPLNMSLKDLLKNWFYGVKSDVEVYYIIVNQKNERVNIDTNQNQNNTALDYNSFLCDYESLSPFVTETILTSLQ